MWWGTLGSVRPFPNFRPERDATVLHTALEKKDVNTIVRILTNRSNAQRRSLAQVYKNFSQKELDASLKKVLSGDLQSLILGLMMIPEQFEAHRLRKAMEGAGTDEETLLEILCTRTPQQLSDIRAAYSQEYKRDLEKDLISETSGDFSKLIVALLKKEIGPGIIDQDIASLSEELKNKKPAADIWIKLLTTRNPDHLRTVLEELEFEKGQTVEDALEGHFKGILSGDLKKGLKTLVQCLKNQYLFLAQRIQTMKVRLGFFFFFFFYFRTIYIYIFINVISKSQIFINAIPKLFTLKLDLVHDQVLSAFLVPNVPSESTVKLKTTYMMS
uniref:Annexin n=1 Tax=Cyprinus carpio TaxID=7962 RepID=A0A8C1YJ25_CYPCA